MDMIQLAKRVQKSLFRLAGFDIRKNSNTGEYAWLGICSIPFSAIFDVGANEGQFAKEAHARFPQAKIYAFEPVPAAYEKLCSWASTVSSGLIKTFPLALGDKRHSVQMHYHRRHSASSSILSTSSEAKKLYPFTAEQVLFDVQVETLDSLLSRAELRTDRPALLKMDVQGYEAHVARGGTSVLKHCDAVITEISVRKLYDGQTCFGELHGLLSSIGLNFRGNISQHYDGRGEILFMDALFTRDELLEGPRFSN
jgi:FkbM family methyltransferase